VKIKDLKNDIANLPDDYEVVLSSAFIIDAKDEIIGVLDCPVIGVAISDEGKELKFVLDYQDTKACFPLKMKPIDVERIE
jgi:hypothetical protein